MSTETAEFFLWVEATVIKENCWDFNKQSKRSNSSENVSGDEADEDPSRPNNMVEFCLFVNWRVLFNQKL